MNAPADTADIRLDVIPVDSSAQMRAVGVDPAVVDDYAEAMRSGAAFPAIVVFADGSGSGYWPGDGFHRIEAAKRIDRTTILAEVRFGTQRDAILHALGANAFHGLRRTDADKRRAVETMLRDRAWGKWSDREIARTCVVDHKTVGKIRRALTGDVPSDRAVTYRDRHGNESTMRVPASTGAATTTLTERMLLKVPTPALVAECRRRGLVVTE